MFQTFTLVCILQNVSEDGGYGGGSHAAVRRGRCDRGLWIWQQHRRRGCFCAGRSVQASSPTARPEEAEEENWVREAQLFSPDTVAGVSLAFLHKLLVRFELWSIINVVNAEGSLTYSCNRNVTLWVNKCLESCSFLALWNHYVPLLLFPRLSTREELQALIRDTEELSERLRRHTADAHPHRPAPPPSSSRPAAVITHTSHQSIATGLLPAHVSSQPGSSGTCFKLLHSLTHVRHFEKFFRGRKCLSTNGHKYVKFWRTDFSLVSLCVPHVK